MDPYIAWLKVRCHPLFETAGTYWRPYHHALVPASLKPEPIELDSQQANELLEKSGTLFLRYFSRTYEQPTAFWYMACNEYDFKKLPHKVRTQIRRAQRDCRIERVDPAWLADNGYPCFQVAFSRYRNARPESREEFEEMCRGSIGGPFEFWAAFVGDQLVGFAKCVVGNDYCACVVSKLDPRFLSLSPSSALHDAMLRTYVSEQQKTVTCGFRNVVHDTDMHRFLLQFGYRRVYCDLKVRYRPLVRALVSVLYPFRLAMRRALDSGWTDRINALLFQEEIRRTFE
jgi:hypothetical protein